MALRNATVDVFLATYSQVAGDRSGVVGRLRSVKNGVVTHYDPGSGRPRRVVVQQRTGFETLTTVGHNSNTGVTETIAWANPELLSTIGSELLSIANAIPRVYDGTDWTHYGAERCVSNRLSEEVFHTSQRTIQAPDSAWRGGVTCSVWAERINPETTTVVLYVGFKGDDGAWVRTPQVLYDPAATGDSLLTFARVIADEDANRFWVVFNSLVSSADKWTVKLFDLNGVEKATANIAKIWDVPEPGYFDIVQIVGGGCFLAQPLHTLVEDADGVSFTAFTQAADTISSVTTANADIHCRGPLAWMTNDLDDDNWYLATIGAGEDPAGTLWGYQISPPSPNPFAHEYDFEVHPAAGTITDSLIGFVTPNTNPDNVDNIPDLTVSFTSLQSQAATSGPAFDPQFRYSEVWTCDFDDTETFIRQNDYTCQVSRAFLHDDEYYSLNYYQSGSGNVITSTQIEVDFTPDDYMIGSAEQVLTVAEGVDRTIGAPKTFIVSGGAAINVTAAQVSFAIASPDKVEIVTINPAGRGTMTLLKWTLANLTATYPDMAGSRLTIAASSIPTANFTWDIVLAAQDGSIYTLTSSTNGGTLIPGTFSAAGGQSATVVSMTVYQIFELPTAYNAETASFLVGGSMVVTGNGTSANNGTKTIQRAIVGSLNPGDPYGYDEGIWITTGSEATSFAGFTAELHPSLENQWFFAHENFDDALLVGPHGLIVESDGFTLPGSRTGGPVAVNNSSTSPEGYQISDVPSVHSVETDTGTAVVAQVFRTPLPKATIKVPADVTPYTFFLQDLTVDYTLKGALLIVSGDTFQSVNNAVFTIDDIDPDPSHHIVYCKPTDGRTNYRSQLFYADQQSITVVIQTNVQPEFQPCWLMVPLTGTKPVVGRFEYGIAFADWRYEGNTNSNPVQLFPLAVASVVRNNNALTFVLPYRAISFTVGQTVVTASGQVVNAAISSNASTVGIKQFALEDEPGTASVASGEMLLPGPMCGEFTASGFHENGVNFGFEQPFVVSQQESDNGVGLRIGGVYQIVVVAEVTDEDGDRVFSIPSPPMNFTLSGANNSITYGGRMLQPLDEDGIAAVKHFGVTNYRLVGISIYRTAYQDNVQTTERHKITLDLNVNGLAPISDTNDSGFSFPDEFTWNYLDENLDAAILPAEVCYIDKGYLPRFPAPAQRGGVFWKNRSWVIGYDGAIWMSGEKKEGDATWFFPLFRYVLPTTDKPVSIAEMDDYLEVQCTKSLWYIPSATFPDATGRGGTLPAPIQLPFTNGGTGHAITLRSGVAYSSTAGGVWLVTRAHENKWLSQPIQDVLNTQPITSMCVDKRQRLHVTVGTGEIFTYDQVIEEWYRWTLPTSDAHFLSTLDGEAVFQDAAHVWIANPARYTDSLAGDPTPIALDIELYSLQFGNVRNLKAVWEMQLIGTYKGPHHLNAVLSYPDDAPDEPTIFPDPDDGPYTPDPTAPYLYAINPQIEQASSYALRVFADFDEIEDPGNSFELELVSVEVGVDSGSGLDKMRDSRRIVGGT